MYHVLDEICRASAFTRVIACLSQYAHCLLASKLLRLTHSTRIEKHSLNQILIEKSQYWLNDVLKMCLINEIDNLI